MSPNKWSGKGWKITVTDTEMTVAQASGSVTIPGTERLPARGATPVAAVEPPRRRSVTEPTFVASRNPRPLP